MAIDELLKKNNLPTLKELDSSFDLSEISDKKSKLRFICSKISEKLEHFCVILEGLIQPDNTFSNMHEYEVFSDMEKKQILETYKTLMFFHRRNLEVELENGQTSADFIREFWDEWPEIKKHLSFILGKMKGSWKSSKIIKAELEYLG